MTSSKKKKKKVEAVRTTPPKKNASHHHQAKSSPRSEPKSEPAGPAFPSGWTKKVFERKSGATSGQTDTYWFSPQTQRRFRSMVEIRRFWDACDDFDGDEEMAWNWMKGKKSDHGSRTPTKDSPKRCGKTKNSVSQRSSDKKSQVSSISPSKSSKSTTTNKKSSSNKAQSAAKSQANGDDTWSLSHVFSIAELSSTSKRSKSKPRTCQTVGCDLIACSTWISKETRSTWDSCYDCQLKDFGRWPLQLPGTSHDVNYPTKDKAWMDCIKLLCSSSGKKKKSEKNLKPSADSNTKSEKIGGSRSGKKIMPTEEEEEEEESISDQPIAHECKTRPGPWTIIEEYILLHAVQKHGEGNWSEILDDEAYRRLRHRKDVDLKDKWSDIVHAILHNDTDSNPVANGTDSKGDKR